MRSLLTLVVVFAASAVLAPIVVVARIFGVPTRRGGIYERCMRAWAKSVLFAAGARVRVHGAENILANEGAVYISNHTSWFDVFAIAATLPACTFVAKDELRRIPIFGPGAKAAGLVFLDRDNQRSAFDSYKQAAAQVSGGRSVVVCPEGTRGKNYSLRPFKKGPFVLAITAQARVVPTVTHGALEMMPKGTFRVRSGIVDIHFLPAVPTEGMTYDDRAALMSEVWHRMADALAREYGVESTGNPIARAKERTA
jgi:1-acyl-sn-glycerol-3-phosphate acyltransferase